MNDVAQAPSSERDGGAGNVLVINAGSSSLKYQIVDPVTGEFVVKGLAERVGDSGGTITHEYRGEKTTHDVDMADHGVALEEMTKVMAETGLPIEDADVVVVGHRVVRDDVGLRRVLDPLLGRALRAVEPRTVAFAVLVDT